MNPPEGKCLGVFGLSLYTNENDLNDVFSRYGYIDKCNIVIDQKVNINYTHCFSSSVLLLTKQTKTILRPEDPEVLDLYIMKSARMLWKQRRLQMVWSLMVAKSGSIFL